MLFSMKNRLGSALLLLGLLVAGAWCARQALGLTWRLEPAPGVAPQVLLWLGIFLVGDGVLHGAFWTLFGERYRSRYHALAAYFRPQGPAQIAAGALAAAGEELLFRGTLLEALISRTGMGTGPWGLGAAIVLTAGVFGACHLLPDRRLAPFALWAVWQGVLLGLLYVMTGSLLVSLLVHAAHDALGFSLFAWQRRTGWMLGAAGPGE